MNKMAKLDESKATSALKMISIGYTHAKVAAIFGVRRETISKLFRGERWAHVKRQ